MIPPSQRLLRHLRFVVERRRHFFPFFPGLLATIRATSFGAILKMPVMACSGVSGASDTLLPARPGWGCFLSFLAMIQLDPSQTELPNVMTSEYNLNTARADVLVSTTTALPVRPLYLGEARHGLV